MTRKDLTPAVAYLRTSSAANVGPDKDSEKRQMAAIHGFAKAAGYEIIDTFHDVAVSGADPLDSRPGFAALLKRLAANGVRTIIVETASRFARDLIVQETGYERLKAEGIELVAADSPNAFKDDTPTAVFIRQVLGAVAQLDKALTVSKLRGARERKRRDTGRKVEGRKSHAELRPEMVALAKRLHRYPINGRRLSLRQIAARLALEGFVAASGRPLEATTIRRMLAASSKPLRAPPGAVAGLPKRLARRSRSSA